MSTDSMRKAQSQKPSTITRAFLVLEGSRKPLVLQVALSLFEGLAEALILTLFARLALNLVEVGGENITAPLIGGVGPATATLLLFVAIVSRMVIAVANVSITYSIQNKTISKIRRTALNDYSKASWLSQEEIDEGGLQQIVLSLPNGIGGHISSLISNFGQFVIMVSMLAYAMYQDSFMTSILLIIVILATLALRPLRAVIRSKARLALVENRKVASGTTELVNMRFEAHAFGLGNKMVRRLAEHVDSEAKYQANVGRLKGTVVPLYISVSYLAVTFGLFALSVSGPNRLYDAGPILLVVLRSFTYGSAIQQATTSLASLAPMLDVFDERLEALRAKPTIRGTSALLHLKTIELANVSFSYPQTSSPALRNASVSISGGSRVGVIGPSGSGKTTFVRLLLGLVAPSSGQVLLNGEPPLSYSAQTWLQQVGMVPQRVEMLQASIEENVRLFRPHITDDELWEALTLSGLAEDVRALDDGLSTRIGAGGRSLSGGQMQRLAIARALVGRPSMIVMDEPTSSLDARTEEVVAQAVGKFQKHSTFIIISHRMAVLQDCDQLILIDNAEIREVGPPHEVLRSAAYQNSVQA